MKRKKPTREVIGVITQLDVLKKGANKLNKGSDGIVRQGTGVHESKQRKGLQKKKTTRQYLTDYDRVMEIQVASLYHNLKGTGCRNYWLGDSISSVRVKLSLRCG